MADIDPKSPTRQELASFLPTQRLIRAFESLFKIVPETTNDLGQQVETAQSDADSAGSRAQLALALIDRLASALESIALAPPDVAFVVPNDVAPPTPPASLVDSNLTVGGDLILSKVSGAGVRVDKVAPTFPWQDLIGLVLPKTSGVGAPTLDTIQGNTRGFRYSVGDDGDGDFHILHDHLPGSELYGHTHWLWTNSNNAGTALNAGATISGAFRVVLFLSYAKGHNQANMSPEISVPIYWNTVDATTTPALRHRIDEQVVSAPGGLISFATNVSITSGTATLTAASALFSPGDVGRSIRVAGAGTAGGNLDVTISAYTSTTQVTLSANASTTVTTQPAFYHRVLNSSNFEPDGIIVLHYDVAEIPVIVNAGGPTEPFIKFIDIHYQSTGRGTKQKAPNFDV